MLKVMLVDDDVNVGKCLRALINWNALGYEIVAEAFNGIQAYQMAMETNPDVIITDIKMPGMDGTELCKRIRESMCDVYIIFLSAYEDFSTAQLALRYHVNDYILKPINKKKVAILSDVLAQLAENYKNKDYFQNLLRNKDAEKEIIKHLKIGEVDYFVAFFEKFTNCSVGDFAVVKEACFKLINILYNYLEYAGIDGEITNKRKPKTFHELEELKKKMDMVTFTSKLYFDVLQFGNKKKDDYYHNMMEKIKAYIQDSYGDPDFNVSSVADKFNFSPDYIGKLFSQYSGCTMSAYISAIRLNKAIELLRDTEISINDIASIVGYASPNYFAKVFKKSQNLTPSEYRAMVRTAAKEVGESGKL